MKTMYLALASLLLAAPALAGETPTVPEPGGIAGVVGVIAALLVLKATRK